MSRYEDLKDRARETIFDNVMGEIEAPKHQKMIHDILDRLEIDVDDLYDTSDSHTEDISQLKSDVEIKLDAEQYNSDKELQKEIDGNQDKRIDDNRVKISESNQEIKVIKDTLKHLNSNDEIQEVKGGSVTNLPNNAMKSVVPNYRFEGLTVQNLYERGEHWSELTDSPQASNIQNISNSVNDNIYISTLVSPNEEAEDYNARFMVGDTRVDFNSLTSPTGTRCSAIVKAEKANSFITIWGSPKGRSKCKERFAVNLTQMFGAGNEPSKEWCDANLPDYVEGAKSVQLPMRVKSVGENLLIPKFKEGRYNVYKGAPVSVRSDLYGVYWEKPIKYIQGNILYFNSMGNDYNNKVVFVLSEDGEVVSDYKEVFINTPFTYQTNCYVYVFTGVSGKKPNLDNFYNTTISKSSILNSKPYQESLAYFNDEVELKSVGKVKDYIENGKLYKNISDDGEILEKTEVVNLSTSGLIEANPNGTVFFEPITNLTGFYDNGLDIEGLDILEVEEFSHLVNGVYQNLDVSKVKVESGKLTHPDAQNGLVYLVYRYDDNPVYGESTISYYNNNRVLESPNGTFFKPVFSVDDEGNITMKGEKL